MIHFSSIKHQSDVFLPDICIIFAYLYSIGGKRPFSGLARFGSLDGLESKTQAHVEAIAETKNHESR